MKTFVAVFAAAVLCLTLNGCGSYEISFPADGGYYYGGYYYGSYYYCPPPPPPPPHHHHR